jgi:hypothetical protein
VDAKVPTGAVLQKREDLLTKLKATFTPKLNDRTVRKIEVLIGALEQQYTQPALEVPRLAVCEPQLTLAAAYYEGKKMLKCLEWIGRALSSLGFAIEGMDTSKTAFAIVKWGLACDYLAHILMRAKEAFVQLGLKEKVEQADAYAKTAFKILVGEDASFKKMYP